MVRSGDVIPKIKSVVKPAEQPLMPTVPYVWNSTHVDIILQDVQDNETVRMKKICLDEKNSAWSKKTFF